MSEEKEIVPETNGKGNTDDDTNDNDTTAEESKPEEINKNENLEYSSDLDAQIIRQVEYYFGDLNLPRDKFLHQQTQLDDGWVPLEMLIRFNRLSKLSTDVDSIENALKKSTSGILEIADKKVRRNPEQPVPEMNEDRRKDLMARTIYAKGFPKDISLDQLLSFFKNLGEVENIIMRRYLDVRTKARMFKGSIFATFKTKAQAEKFLELKDSLKYKDKNLLVMWQDEYVALKEVEKKDRGKKRDKKSKQIEKSEQPEKSEFILPTGTVLYFEEGHDKMTREEIKSAVSAIDKKCDVAFIDFKIGLTKGWIRFSQENAAVEFFKLLSDGNLVIGDHKVSVRVLEGDEEKKYLEKTVDEMSKRRKNMKTFKHKGKNNYKGKHQKRRRENDNEDGPPAKVKCDS